MHSVLGNHKTMTHQYTVNVIHVYRGLIVFTQQVTILVVLCYYWIHPKRLTELNNCGVR